MADAPPTHLTVDGFEGDQARVELPGGHTEVWPRHRLPRRAKQGDVLVPGKTVAWKVDHARTRERRQQAQAELSALNAGGAQGEVIL